MTLQARLGARYCVAFGRRIHPSLPPTAGVFPVLAETDTEITVGTNAVAGDDVELRRDAARIYVTGLAGALDFRAHARRCFTDSQRAALLAAPPPRPVYRAPLRQLRQLRPRVRARRRRAQCRLRSPPSADGDGPPRRPAFEDSQPARLPARGVITRAREDSS